MTHEEKDNIIKCDKITWWKSFMISEHGKLGGESGNIEEGRFLSVWKDDLHQHVSLTTLREVIKNKNESA